MAFTNPLDTLFRGFQHWYVWAIFIIAIIIWLWRIDRDMKNNGGEGLFGSDLFDWENWW